MCFPKKNTSTVVTRSTIGNEKGERLYSERAAQPPESNALGLQVVPNGTRNTIITAIRSARKIWRSRGLTVSLFNGVYLC